MSRLIKSVLTIAAGFILLLPIALVAMKLAGHSPIPVIQRGLNHLPVTLTSSVGLGSREPVVIGNWPPVAGQAFPDLHLTDQTGETVRLSDFRGKILFIEYAAIPCEGCQAFAGGKEHGAFGGFRVQRGLESVETYARRYAGVELGTDQVVFVQVLLYGAELSSPSQEEVEGWADHFQMERAANEIVLRGDPSMLGRDAYNLIPGFQLVDRNFVLRSDSCGHNPQDNLYTDLLPLLGRLVRE